MTWQVEHHRGSAADFHARTLAEPLARTVAVLEVEAPALVLGSAQDPEIVDRPAAESAGVAVVRRRTGGGAVLVEAGGATWVDLLLPRDDPLWCEDVGRAAHWVGEAWAVALDAVGAGPAEVHHGGLCTTSWSRLVCFGGLGPGEVTVGGRKVVGISQRRSRPGAWFQTLAVHRWEPARLLALLRLDPAERAAATSALTPVVQPVAPAGLVDALLTSLPA